MRFINRIVVHCSATKNDPKITASTIDKWHRQKGWLQIGYHFVICTDGSIEFGRPLTEVGAHAQGFNSNSIGICLIGGLDVHGNPENNFTWHQFRSLRLLIETLLLIKEISAAEILGHRDLPGVAKDCPCFNVKSWWQGT